MCKHLTVARMEKLQRAYMQATLIQRQYDEVIAENYDLDPQQVTGNSLDRALGHLEKIGILNPEQPPLTVLDLGMGTGMFLERLRERSHREIRPFGIDLSSNMLRIARQKLPDLQAEVDDAACFDDHFGDQRFDLICTHFVTGFVAIEHLAPLVMKRLAPGGYWSFVGASKQAYPKLRRKSESPVLRAFLGGGLDLSKMICPDDLTHLTDVLSAESFETTMAECFEPELFFGSFHEFMEYAYTGGWLTPFIEELGLNRAGRAVRVLLDQLVFPISDHHSILTGLFRKPLTA